MQESIYESCLVSNRKQVHKAIAKFLELDQSTQLSDNYSLIAHHHVQAEEWRSACLYLQLSSEVSERLEMPHTVVEALTQWRHIKEEKLMQTDDGKKDGAINGRFGSARTESGVVHMTLGKALFAMNRYQEALDSFHHGAARAGQSFPSTTSAKLGMMVSVRLIRDDIHVTYARTHTRSNTTILRIGSRLWLPQVPQDNGTHDPHRQGTNSG